MADRSLGPEHQSLVHVRRRNGSPGPRDTSRRTGRWPANAHGKIVLFQPPVGYMDSMRSKPALPLSLLHAASLVWERNEVVIIDQRVQSDWRDRLRHAMSERPLLLGITCYTGPMVRRALEAAALARSIDPDVPILWGGVHVGLLPEQSLRHPLVDMVARGEGEETLAQLVGVLRAGGDLGEVQGLSFMDGDRYVMNPAPRFIDVTAAPEIPYHLVDVEDYMP